MLGMPFINSVLLVTISEDKLIINLKKKAIAVPRLYIENSEARRENSQKKVGTRRPLLCVLYTDHGPVDEELFKFGWEEDVW